MIIEMNSDLYVQFLRCTNRGRRLRIWGRPLVVSVSEQLEAKKDRVSSPPRALWRRKRSYKKIYGTKITRCNVF